MTPVSRPPTLGLGAALTVGALAIACAEPAFNSPVLVDVASVAISPEADALLVGTTLQLRATARDSGGRVIADYRVDWRSSDTAIATVSAGGLLRGVSRGRVTVTATVGGVSGRAAFSIEPVVTAITVSPGDQTIVVDGRVAFTATLRDATGAPAAGPAVAWWSSAPTVATVSPEGMVTGVAPGRASITATTGGLQASVIVEVTVVRFVAVTASDFSHACGLTAGGQAFCWGENGHQELGSGSGEISPAPVGVSGALLFTALSAGGSFTCGLTASGAVYCWGSGEGGRLGDEMLAVAGTPVPLRGGARYVALSAGLSHTCVVQPDGAASCWGSRGGLGNYERVGDSAPLSVLGDLRFRAVTAGYRFTCGVAQDDRTYCWGTNNYGQLGTDSVTATVPPVAAVGGLSFVALAAGERHVCGLTAAGAAYCWGDNYFGQLGGGAVLSSTAPVPVAGGLAFRSLAAGVYFTCGVTTDATTYCWGDNLAGQLGAPATDYCGGRPCSRTPVPVSAGLRFTMLAGGYDFTCGLDDAGIAYCWGGNGSGQLGDGTTVDRAAPGRVMGQP